MPDKDKDSLLSFRAAQQWQRKASEKRQDDARRAGLGSSTDNYAEYTRRNTQSSRNSKLDGENDSAASLEMQKKKKRRTLEATRISNVEQGFELCYHEPIKVKFKSTVERPSTVEKPSTFSRSSPK
ncbi:hypothetical protein ACLKA6_005877 [Drosophila palustris]